MISRLGGVEIYESYVTGCYEIRRTALRGRYGMSGLAIVGSGRYGVHLRIRNGLRGIKSWTQG